MKQETVAYLGSIDATWLDSFWAAPDPSVLDKIRAPWWEQRSIRERIAFWQVADKRLKKLANRFGPDAKRLQMSVHAQIPWPMESGRDRLKLLEAERDLALWDEMFEMTRRQYKEHEQSIETAKKKMAELGLQSVRDAKGVAATRERIAKIKAKMRT